MKPDNEWSPKKGDYRRTGSATNRSIAQKEKMETRKKTIRFIVAFFLLLAATLLGNFLFCNTKVIN